MTKLPIRDATVANLPKGTCCLLGGSWWQIGGRPKPGFVALKSPTGTSYVRLKTKVSVLSSGKVH